MFVLTALSPLISSNVHADSFVVTLDNLSPEIGDTLLISGEIIDFSMPIIAMSVYDPDGKILSANNLEISSNSFSKSISLDSQFYEKTGEYTIKFDYGQITQNYHFEIQSSESEIIIKTDDTPEILLLYTEKKQYYDKDIIKISGLVSSLDSPTVLIGIYDPFGMPAGFYFGMVNSELEFTTSFLVKDGVNFRAEGMYSVKAHYAETEAVSFFEYVKVESIIIPETDTLEEIVDDIEIISNLNEDEILDEINEKESLDDMNFDSVGLTDEEIIDDVFEEVLDEIIDEEIIIDETIEEQNEILENEIFDTSIISNEQKNVKEKTKIIEITETKIINEKNDPEIILPEIKIEKQNNLSVEDIELGKILNQINLECDSDDLVDLISYYDGMGPALYRLCKFDSSLNFFTDSLKKEPNDVKILVNTGSTLRKLGDFSKAIFYYDLALEINPTFLPAKNNKANALVNLGNVDDAIILYEKILDENPDSITLQKNLKVAYSLIDESENKIISDGESIVQNIISDEHVIVEKIQSLHIEKEKPINFFDQLNNAFSSFFNFLN